jgi:hypothetical protein
MYHHRMAWHDTHAWHDIHVAGWMELPPTDTQHARLYHSRY